MKISRRLTSSFIKLFEVDIINFNKHCNSNAGYYQIIIAKFQIRKIEYMNIVRMGI